MGGGNVIEPFSRVLLGGKTKKRTTRKTKKNTKMKKNISRKKATRRVERSNKRSINKRTNRTKGKRGKRGKNRGTIKRKTTSKKKRQCNCDTSRTYHGNEPSPKGLGFCAHCTPLNVTMKGLDGNLWENQKYTKGKRWIKVRVDMN
jgi:hypothetical protein